MICNFNVVTVDSSGKLLCEDVSFPPKKKKIVGFGKGEAGWLAGWSAFQKICNVLFIYCCGFNLMLLI